MTKKRFAAIGECMLEFRKSTGQEYTLGFAGDTLNVSVYLARLTSRDGLEVSYITALGTDPYSEMMLSAWRKEGMAIDNVVSIDGKLPGLYLIDTDPSGERRFFYYRSQSAAREFFRTAIADLELKKYDYVYFSGITLAILDEKSQHIFFDLLRAAKDQGANIIFDSNYREALWENLSTAQKVIGHFLSLVDIGLPTFVDEASLFGDRHPEACLLRWEQAGVREIVLKLGEKGCLFAFDGKTTQVALMEKQKAMDTTGAGDSFNAGYLAGRLRGLEPMSAVKVGQKLAAAVIQHQGAIIPQSEMPREIGI